MSGLLAAHQPAPIVVQIQGMPGIGKSAFLDELAAEARGLDYAVHEVSRELGGEARANAVWELLGSVQRKTLLVIDDADALAAEESRLVETLERTTGPLVLALGSRLRPRPCFLESGLFPARFHSIELEGLSEADSVRLLHRHGMSPADASVVHRECDGQPFAMLLMATLPGLAGRVPPTAGEANLDRRRSVMADLAHRIVGQIADPRLSDALGLLSLAGTLNEYELGVALELGSDKARALFGWLQTQAIVRPSATGPVLNDLVRSVLVADLHVRDPCTRGGWWRGSSPPSNERSPGAGCPAPERSDSSARSSPMHPRTRRSRGSSRSETCESSRPASVSSVRPWGSSRPSKARWRGRSPRGSSSTIRRR